MSTQTVSRHQGEQSLVNAIQRRDRAVITLRLNDGWRTHSTEFVSGNKSAGRVTLLIRARADDATVELPAKGEGVGVTFRAGHKKCMFATIVADTPKNSDGLLITLEWPATVDRLQRRAFERVAPPQGIVIPVRFWKAAATGGEAGDRSNVRHAQLEDFSAGGMRIRTADLADIVIGAMYRCAFAPGKRGATLVVDARLRHREASDRGRASLGFQYIGLETTTEGRRTLTRIARMVQQFQRGGGGKGSPRRPGSATTCGDHGEAQ